jgi:hypothetical protein
MKRALVLAMGLMLLSGPALADDIFAPVWRGEENTVFAEWNTWDGFNTTPAPFYPDTWTSVPGGLVSPDAQAYETAQYWAAYENRDEVVEVNGFAQIDFALPNFANQTLTELWIQLTYWAADPTDVTFLVDTDPYTPDINGPYLEGTFDHDFGWVTEAYSLTILPSVNYELIALDFAAAPVFIDQVIVESVAVPEPATLALVGLLLLGWRRR